MRRIHTANWFLIIGWPIFYAILISRLGLWTHKLFIGLLVVTYLSVVAGVVADPGVPYKTAKSFLTSLTVLAVGGFTLWILCRLG